MLLAGLHKDGDDPVRSEGMQRPFYELLSQPNSRRQPFSTQFQ
jgi:hypothetical protein